MKTPLRILTFVVLCAGPASADGRSYEALKDLAKAAQGSDSVMDSLKAGFSALAAKKGPETDRFLESYPQEAAKYQAMEVVHPPVARGWCSMCHSSTEDPLEMRDEVNVLCQTCHQVKSEPLMRSHMGVNTFAGKCTVCHDPHASSEPRILRDTGQHGGFVAGCANCHTGVSTDGRPALPGPIAKACFKCHPGIEEAMKDKVVHGALQMGACTNCHNPHVSARRVHLRGVPQEFCQDCHNIPEKGHPFGKHRSFKIGGVARGPLPGSFDCTNCHKPHSGDQPKLLRVPRKELCMNCHKM